MLYDIQDILTPKKLSNADLQDKLRAIYAKQNDLVRTYGKEKPEEGFNLSCGMVMSLHAAA